jgi:gliding motility-associated-like protein
MVFTDGVTGCQNSSATGLVTVNPTPTVTIVTSDTVCVESTINFLPSTGGSWTSSDPTVATIDNTGLITGISGGTVTMVFTDGVTGCPSSSTSGVVTVNPMPIVSDTSGGVVCEGNAIYLTPSSGGIWTSSDPTVATIDITGMVTGISAGTANMVFADGVTGCQNSSATGLVTVNPTPTITTVTSDTVCEGSTINLLPSTGGSWTSSDPTVATIDNTGLITGISGGTATMVFTDGTTGCSSNLTSGVVTVNPRPTVTDTTGGFVCEGYGMYFTTTSSGTWTSSDPTVATIDNTGYVTGIAIGTANMVFTDAITGCKNSITSGLVVVGGVSAILDVTPSSGIMPLEVVFTNGSTPAITYLWDFGDGTLITSVFEPNHIYTDFGDFIATLIVTDGLCFDTATVTIEVQGISSILIPNVFTPNGDGFNDVFAVGGTNLESVEAEIFNRWGQKMYEWKHVKGYWDGRTQSGLEAPEGTYFYIISAKGLDGEEYFKKGGFSLIR